MKKNGIITLILSALILVSCSDVPYTTGKIGLSDYSIGEYLKNYSSFLAFPYDDFPDMLCLYQR